MAAVMMRLGAELRGRWRAWLALGIVIGMSAALVLAALAGSRRTASSYDRFLERNRAWHAITFYAPFDPSFATLSHEQVAPLPSVEEAIEGRYYPVPGFFDSIASLDPSHGRSFDRYKMIAGRALDHAAPHEILVPYELSDRIPPVGEEIEVPFLTKSPGGGPFESGDPSPVKLTVVGVFVGSGDFPPEESALSESDDPAPLLSKAFHDLYGDRLFNFGFGMFRIAGGDDGVPRFNQEVGTVAGGKPYFVMAQRDQTVIARRALRLISAGLIAFALVLIVVGLLGFGQTIARQTFLESEGLEIGRALGMTTGQLFGVGMLRAALIGTVAAVIGVAGAIALSPLAPVSIARVVEVSPGVSADWLVLAPGAIAVVLAVMALAVYPSLRAERARRDGISRPSRFARLAFRLGSPPPVVAGMRLALERGRGRTAVPVRTTLGGATLGIAALLMAFTFGSSLERLLSEPESYGVRWDVEATVSAEGRHRVDPAKVQRALSDIRALDVVESAALMDLGAPFEVDGISAATILVDPTEMSLAPQLIDGRYPRDGKEIAVGVKTFDQLGKRLGSTVKVAVSGAGEHTFTLVGIVATPGVNASDSLGEGSLALPSAVARFIPDPPPSASIQVRAAEGVGNAELTERVSAVAGIERVAGRNPPVDLVNLRRVRDVPAMLAGALALLAATAIGHALLSSARRRARELAILRTLGFVRRQIGATLAWQGATVAVVALILGIPLGIASGRWLWNATADSLGVIASPAAPFLVVAVAAPSAIVLALLLSARPTRLAVRARPAEVLRVE